MVFSILAIVFGASALVATGITPYVIHRERKLRREGVTAMGTVVKVEENEHDSGYHALVEFFVAGVRHSFFASTQRDGYRVGESVRVRYLRETPHEGVIDRNSGIYRRTILALTLSTTFWVVTGIMLALRAQLGDK